MSTMPEKTATELLSLPPATDHPATGDIREDRWAALMITWFGGLFVLILIWELFYNLLR